MYRRNAPRLKEKAKGKEVHPRKEEKDGVARHRILERRE